MLGLTTIYSDDAGTSWSAVGALQTPYSATIDRGAVGGAILAHSSGVLLNAVYGQNTGDTADRMGVYRSTDNGASWGSLIPISAQNGGYNEASLIELPDTSIAAIIRQDVTPSPLVKSTSTNVGVSWSGLTSLGWNTNPGLPGAIVSPLDGSVLLYYRQVTTSKAVYRWSLDLLATWSAEQLWSNSVYVYAGGYSLGGATVGSVVAIEQSSSRADVLFESYAFA